MGLFIFLTVLQALVAAVLVVLVLMQRSEGGGLGIGGGGPGGVMSARGAADFLSRATKWAAVLFVVLAIVLAGVAVNTAGTRPIDQSLDRTVSTANQGSDPLAPAALAPDPLAPNAAAPDPLAPTPGAPDPLAGVGSAAGVPAQGGAGGAGAAPAEGASGADPLAGLAR